VHGYTNAIWFAVGILVLAATIAATFVNTGKPEIGPASGEGAEDEMRIPVIAH
jgi:hypothetical protein